MAERDAARAEAEMHKSLRAETLKANENLRAEVERLRAEVERLRAEVVRLRLALRGLLREVEGGEHHPEECPRCADCDNHGEGGCRRCKSYDCPECECGLSETLRAIAAAREALAWSGSQPSET